MVLAALRSLRKLSTSVDLMQKIGRLANLANTGLPHFPLFWELLLPLFAPPSGPLRPNGPPLRHGPPGRCRWLWGGGACFDARLKHI